MTGRISRLSLFVLVILVFATFALPVFGDSQPVVERIKACRRIAIGCETAVTYEEKDSNGKTVVLKKFLSDEAMNTVIEPASDAAIKLSWNGDAFALSSSRAGSNTKEAIEIHGTIASDGSRILDATGKCTVEYADRKTVLEIVLKDIPWSKEGKTMYGKKANIFEIPPDQSDDQIVSVSFKEFDNSGNVKKDISKKIPFQELDEFYVNRKKDMRFLLIHFLAD